MKGFLIEDLPGGGSPHHFVNAMSRFVLHLAAKLTAIVLAGLLVVGPQLMVSGMAGAGADHQSELHHQHHAQSPAQHHHGAQGDCCDFCAGCPACGVVATVSLLPIPVAPVQPRAAGLERPVLPVSNPDYRLPFPVGPPSLRA